MNNGKMTYFFSLAIALYLRIVRRALLLRENPDGAIRNE